MSAFGSAAAPDHPAVRAVRRRLTAERRVALRDAWSALWWSRTLVWGAGLAALIAIGPHRHNEQAYDPAGLTRPFGALGDLLVGPATRWDSQWFLLIAKDGYVDDDRTAFFPLYPLLAHVVGAPFASPLLGGLVVSFAAFGVALYLLHRLTVLELGAQHARTAVLLCAFFPMSFYFSAVYSEALFLALAVGGVYAARLGRWPVAALLAVLAGTSRSAGGLLLIPLAILWFQSDRRRLRDAAWLVLVPLGPAVYAVYLQLVTGDANAAFSAQDAWMRHFAGPFAGIWDGTVAAFDGARQLLSGSRTPVYFKGAAGDPFSIAGHNLTLFAFLVLAAIATAGVLRRLPLAYGAWCVAMLALPLSYPVSTQPLMSLPRFAAVLFPGYMWLALWLDRRRVADWGLAVSAVALVVFSAQFACWVWIA
jgi:Mannosyltransferase (PIG-V)